MSTVSFTIPGSPVGKGRPRFARRGNYVSTYTPEKTASYENLVKIFAVQAMIKDRVSIIEGAVSVNIRMFISPPASWSKKKRLSALNGDLYPTTKPDIDNCIKGIFDACNDIVWRDDRQVVDLTVPKRYAETARAEVCVTSLTEP